MLKIMHGLIIRKDGKRKESILQLWETLVLE